MPRAKRSRPAKPINSALSEQRENGPAHGYARLALWKAKAVLGVTRLLRRDRAHWQHVLAGVVGDPDHLVAICSYCQLVRDRRGVWGAIPEWVMKALHHWPHITLTHGICGECEAIHFPKPSNLQSTTGEVPGTDP